MPRAPGSRGELAAAWPSPSLSRIRLLGSPKSSAGTQDPCTLQPASEKVPRPALKDHKASSGNVPSWESSPAVRPSVSHLHLGASLGSTSQGGGLWNSSAGALHTGSLCFKDCLQGSRIVWFLQILSSSIDQNIPTLAW